MLVTIKHLVVKPITRVLVNDLNILLLTKLLKLCKVTFVLIYWVSHKLASSIDTYVLQSLFAIYLANKAQNFCILNLSILHRIYL